MKIKLEDVDELFMTLTDIDLYTYFQMLLEYDKSNEVIGGKNLDKTRRYAEFVISQKQHEAVSKMWEIIDKEGFLEPI